MSYEIDVDEYMLKILRSAATLLRRAVEAAEQRAEQVLAFIEFDASLPEESTAQWTVMVKAWELDCTQPNPFDCTERRKLTVIAPGFYSANCAKPGITEHAVRLELARDDASTINDSSQVIHEHMPPSILLTQGLELEEQQCARFLV